MEYYEEIQKYYDDGHTIAETCLKFNISESKAYRASKRGQLKFRSLSEAMKISCKKKPRKHTDETKEKLSKIRKEYLRKNPNKVPYLLNHSSKGSYPEKYFTEVFKREGLDVVKKFRVSLYELDFSIPHKKIDIEIDGNQHYDDIKIVESDIRRNEFLETEGWDVIRINWSNYQKLNYKEKNMFINDLKSYVNNLSEIKPTITTKPSMRGKNLCECGGLKTKKSKLCKICRHENSKKRDIKSYKSERRKKYKCNSCGNKCTNKNKRCRKCYEIDNRKVTDRPSKESLIKDIENIGYSATGRKYGVSDNTIRKWIKN